MEDSNEQTTQQADSYLPTDWPVKDSQIAEVAAVHGIANNDYDRLKAELKAKLKAEKQKPHEVINYGVRNEHPSHSYSIPKNPVKDSYDTPKKPVKDSYRPPPPTPSYGVPVKEPHSPYGIPEKDLYGKPPPPTKTYSEPPPRPQPTYDIPKETYNHPKEELNHPSYSVPNLPPPPKGGYALPKPPIGAIIDSYGLPKVKLPPSYHDEVPVYSPTGPPMPQMYYDVIPDYRHPEKKKPVIERPSHSYNIPKTPVKDSYDLHNTPIHGPHSSISPHSPHVGFVPTAPGNNFDDAIFEAVNKEEEDKFSFEGFSDSFPFGRKAPLPPPPSFKRDIKKPPKKENSKLPPTFGYNLKSKNKPVYSGKAKFPPAPSFKTPAFENDETPTGYSIFKQSSFKDDYDGLPYSLDPFKDDYNGPEFRAGGQFDDYEEDVRDVSPLPPQPPPQLAFENDLPPPKFPVRESAPLIKPPQPPPPPPPPGPPPPPPPPFPKMSKHGALDVAEIGA